MAIPVTINHSGPYEFIVDTGAQLTTVDPSLAADLRLEPEGAIEVLSVSMRARAQLVRSEVIEAGPYAVHRPLLVVQSLAQIQALNPEVRGVLGENLLAHFDLLIDHAHKILCLDETKQMREEVSGERIPFTPPLEPQSDSPYTQPVLISVHLWGNGSRGTTLMLDSGSNVPVLFANHLETATWTQKNHAQRGGVTGNAVVSFAPLSSRQVRIGERWKQIAFVMPLENGRPVADTRADGLLPTVLFKRVFISHTGHYVIFDPSPAVQ